MAKILKVLMLVLGIAIVLIGCAHILLGAEIILGAGTFSPSIDSEDRFFGAIFVGYGLAWIWSARNDNWQAARFLAAIFFLGGVARLISIWQAGMPDNLYVVLTAVELLLPVAIVALVRAVSGKA